MKEFILRVMLNIHALLHYELVPPSLPLCASLYCLFMPGNLFHGGVHTQPRISMNTTRNERDPFDFIYSYTTHLFILLIKEQIGIEIREMLFIFLKNVYV